MDLDTTQASGRVVTHSDWLSSMLIASVNRFNVGYHLTLTLYNRVADFREHDRYQMS
jgi:hypothetical protein